MDPDVMMSIVAHPIRMYRWVAMGLALGLAACATAPPSATAPRGDVRLEAVRPPEADEQALPANEDMAGGAAVTDSLRLPKYPPELLGRDVPELEVCIELTIDPRGVVIAAEAIAVPDLCVLPADDLLEPVLRESRTAVASWSFLPTYACTLPPGAVADGTCDAAVGELDAVSSLRAYRFVFRQTADGADVEMRSGVDG